MECLRCGACCLWDVFIPVQSDGVWWVAHKPQNVRCPHYFRGETMAECRIHGQAVFQGSPCDRYGNQNYDVDFLGKRVCSIGQAMPKAYYPTPESLETEGVELLELFTEW